MDRLRDPAFPPQRAGPALGEAGPGQFPIFNSHPLPTLCLGIFLGHGLPYYIPNLVHHIVRHILQVFRGQAQNIHRVLRQHRNLSIAAGSEPFRSNQDIGKQHHGRSHRLFAGQDGSCGGT